MSPIDADLDIGTVDHSDMLDLMDGDYDYDLGNFTYEDYMYNGNLTGNDTSYDGLNFDYTSLIDSLAGRDDVAWTL